MVLVTEAQREQGSHRRNEASEHAELGGVPAGTIAQPLSSICLLGMLIRLTTPRIRVDCHRASCFQSTGDGCVFSVTVVCSHHALTRHVVDCPQMPMAKALAAMYRVHPATPYNTLRIVAPPYNTAQQNT